jgi:hypothetical protein
MHHLTGCRLLPDPEACRPLPCTTKPGPHLAEHTAWFQFDEGWVVEVGGSQQRLRDLRQTHMLSIWVELGLGVISEDGWVHRVTWRSSLRRCCLGVSSHVVHCMQELCAMMIRAAFASVHFWPNRVLDAAAG